MDAPYKVLTLSECKAIDNTIDTQLSSLLLICEKAFDELSVIGSGGFGTVYRMRHKTDGQIYAVKKIAIKVFNGTETENALKEVQSLVKVSSQYVVQYYYSWLETGFLFIQMELCSQSLRNILDVKPNI
ncbi:unnamed protein product [Oppiella nova]|uniref:Protein kinase domain-containing protein n=1 Tax=Oppiella nova TaxID=334625 RepID=A0A7R9QDQ3_9ACAR|nr:unnamed protein product [Oppiella nova]CAG2163267.1 unnamed protein product [Oppiella nova]